MKNGLLLISVLVLSCINVSAVTKTNSVKDYSKMMPTCAQNLKSTKQNCRANLMHITSTIGPIIDKSNQAIAILQSALANNNKNNNNLSRINNALNIVKKNTQKLKELRTSVAKAESYF